MTDRDPALYRPPGSYDVLRLPLIGRLLKHRRGRLILQLPLLLVALLLILDGFTGPQSAARNLATVVPWVHYRGLVVLVLLLAGNLFCMGCPFTLPRTLARRLSLRGRRFPRALRNKWLAVASLLLLFVLYEWLDLWASPWLTAWVIVGYFVASFVLEAVFTESAFCKYVCPLGTFNFVYSTAAPTRIAVRQPDICRACVGKECINGSYAPQPVVRVDQITGGDTRTVSHGPDGVLGCGTLLFAPQITSNLDCTLCLDCVRACPHDNIGLMLRPPGQELAQPDAWPARWDVALLAILLATLGLTNAFGMVPPVYELQRVLAETLNLRSDLLVLLLIFALLGVLLPIGVALLAGTLARLLTGTGRRYSLRATVAAFAPAFVPVGLGIWIAHYTFHMLIGFWTIVPVLQERLGQPGEWARFSEPASPEIIGLVQLVAVLGGLVWSLALAQRAALRLYRREAVLGLLPWALMLIACAALAVAIFGMSMEMRGSVLFD
jgi:polyferredoxin